MSYALNQFGRLFYNDVEVPMIIGDPLYEGYIQFLYSGGTVGTIDKVTQEDYNQMIADYRKLYSDKISNIVGMREAVERNTIDGTPIPADILAQREAFRQEYHNLVNQLPIPV